MNFQKYSAILREDNWLANSMWGFAKVHPLDDGAEKKLNSWVKDSLHHISFQPWENLSLEARNTRRRCELPKTETDRTVWEAVVVEKYHIFGRLEDEMPFQHGGLQIDGEFWGDFTSALSCGENSLKEGIEVWSRTFLAVNKKVFKVDAVVKVTMTAIGFWEGYAIDVFRPNEPFVLPQTEWTLGHRYRQ